MTRFSSSAVTTSLVEVADPDISKRERTFVIALQPDVASLRAAELRPVFELGGLHLRFPIQTPELVLDDLDVVQPVLDVRALGNDARLVPLSDRLEVTFR